MAVIPFATKYLKLFQIFRSISISSVIRLSVSVLLYVTVMYKFILKQNKA